MCAIVRQVPEIRLVFGSGTRNNAHFVRSSFIRWQRCRSVGSC